jgi:hypothetical protein
LCRYLTAAPIIAVRGLRVTDYNGVSLSTVARSELFVDPTTADVADKAGHFTVALRRGTLPFLFRELGR